MSEEFALEQRTWDSGAVEREKSFLLPPTAFVNGARDQFLARAGLTQQEHSGIAGGYHFHKFQDSPQHETLTHYSREVRFMVEIFL
jgi:hypothetical protein